MFTSRTPSPILSEEDDKFVSKFVSSEEVLEVDVTDLFEEFSMDTAAPGAKLETPSAVDVAGNKSSILATSPLASQPQQVTDLLSGKSAASTSSGNMSEESPPVLLPAVGVTDLGGESSMDTAAPGAKLKTPSAVDVAGNKSNILATNPLASQQQVTDLLPGMSGKLAAPTSSRNTSEPVLLSDAHVTERDDTEAAEKHHADDDSSMSTASPQQCPPQAPVLPAEPTVAKRQKRKRKIQQVQSKASKPLAKKARASNCRQDVSSSDRQDVVDYMKKTMMEIFSTGGQHSQYSYLHRFVAFMLADKTGPHAKLFASIVSFCCNTGSSEDGVALFRFKKDSTGLFGDLWGRFKGKEDAPFTNVTRAIEKSCQKAEGQGQGQSQKAKAKAKKPTAPKSFARVDAPNHHKKKLLYKLGEDGLQDLETMRSYFQAQT